MNFSQKHLLEKLYRKRKEREKETQENYARDAEREIKKRSVENEIMDWEIEYVMSSVAALYNIVKEKDRTVKVKDRILDRGWWENNYRNNYRNPTRK